MKYLSNKESYLYRFGFKVKSKAYIMNVIYTAHFKGELIIINPVTNNLKLAA